MDSPRGGGRFEQSRNGAARPQASQSPDPFHPVFLHGLWRSGSTYVWSRFRAAEGTLCYYEPLHDGLRRLSGERIRRDTPDNIQNNGHPAMAQPYFAEFAPLVAGRGVRGYRRRFAYSRFAPSRYEDDRALEAYIRGLVDHARGRERSAVLGFNRTGLRVGWIADRFDACNIHIDRDPIDVFSSYLSQLQSGNHYYFVKWMQIIAGNAGYPLFEAVRSEFRQASPLRSLFPGPKKYYRGVVEGASLETLYTITFLAWAVCALHALEHCDLIIDPAQADRPGYGRAIAEAVSRESGLAVNFDDMHTPQPPSPLILAHQQAIEHKVLGWIAGAGADGLFDRSRIADRLEQLSPRRAELLARVV